MNNVSKIMNRARRYTVEVERNLRSREAKIKALEPYKGSTYYDSEVEKINKGIEDCRASLANDFIKDVEINLKNMREAAGRRISKAPTVDQINTLSLLERREKLSISEVQLYAEQLKDCPLALSRLEEIAANSHITMHTIPADAMLETVDRLEGLLAEYVSKYRGDITVTPSATVQTLYQFFGVDDQSVKLTPFMTLEKLDKHFWDKLVASPLYQEQPELFEDGENPTPHAQYFFRDLSALRQYIKDCEESVPENMKDKIADMVLASCPEEYGAKYRNALANKEDLPLNER